MAIYLDSNVLFPWRSFSELDRVAVSIVAWQVKQSVLVPWLVKEESTGHYRRSLEDAVGRLDSAVASVNRVFDELDEVFIEPQPDIDAQHASWQSRLDGFAQTIPVVPEDAVEALRREAWGLAPARRQSRRSGLGSRDAAIWLAIARDHNGRTEEGHFISMDRHFFEDGKLRQPMEQDLTSAHRLHLYDGTANFLSVLGKAHSVEVDVADLSEAEKSVHVVMEAALHIPRAVFEPLIEDHRYRTTVKEVTPIRVLEARRYERETEAVVVVDTEWKIVADVYHQRRDTDGDTLWYAHQDVNLRGTIQMYLPSGDHSDLLPQIISARLKSDYSVIVSGDNVIGMRNTKET